MIETIAYRNVYGAVETAGLVPGEQQRLLDLIAEGGHQEVSWADKRIAKIVRSRWLTDPGFPMLDHSYTYAELKDGTLARVQLPVFQLRKKQWKSDIIAAAKADGVYLKGLGFFDDGVVSILWG